jgi:hypothetical protein
MRNVSDKGCREIQNTHNLCLITFLENRADFEIMWKNTVELGQATDDIMAHALCMLDT